MSLFDQEANDDVPLFPTEPAFLVPVVIKNTPQYGSGHKGVFAAAPIPKGTKFWTWTDRIIAIPSTKIQDYIDTNFHDNKQAIQTFLRQGFVLPDNNSVFYSNPTDAGRFMNHSSTPNCGPDGTLRDIQKGEELTMNYGFHGNPSWYQDICRKYNVRTEAEIAHDNL